MKLHSKAVKIAIFSPVFLFFILPPLFNTQAPQEVFSNWIFPYSQLFLFILSLALLFLTDNLFFDLKKQKHSLSYRLIFPSIFCFCVLCGISFLLNGIAIIINHDSIQNKITFPKSFVSWIFCSLTFIFSAFFEETIYRLYLPETLKDLLKSDSKLLLNKTEIYAVEIFTALIFALSHRYAGIFSVINALLAHIVLRICQKKSLSIYAGFVAHFAYNMISLLLLSMN